MIEHGHTVMLGWSEQVFLTLTGLPSPTSARAGSCVAILSEQDRVTMEGAIRDRLDLPRHLRVVCRTGNPTDPIDVPIVSPERAKAVIVLGAEDDDSDARTIKSLLALDAAGRDPEVQVVAGVAIRTISPRLASRAGAARRSRHR